MNAAPPIGDPARLPFFADLLASGEWAEHEQHIEEYATAQPVGPCPFWCSLPAGHPWRSDIVASMSRAHGHECGGGVAVTQTEHNDGECGDVYAYLHEQDVEMTDTAEMRRLAAGILNAADKLDEIRGAQ